MRMLGGYQRLTGWVEAMGRQTPAGRLASLRGRIGGLALAAQRDPREYTGPARQAFLRRFEEEVDPEHKLPEAERLRRATAARRLYFAKLALRSAQARRTRKGELDE
jgi:hypothetical protein